MKQHHPSACILVIALTADACEFYQRVLQTEAFQVETISPQEAVLPAFSPPWQPDLLLVDVDAETQDEHLLWQWIEQYNAIRESVAIPVLICIPTVLSPTAIPAIQHHHIATLFKPVQADDVVRAVHILLSSPSIDSSRPVSLEDQPGFYQAIVSSSDDAIVTKTLDGIITSWNRAAERLFGYDAHEAIGQSIALVIPTELHQEETEILQKLRRGEHIEHYETVRLRKDGRLVEVSLSISPVKDRTGRIIGATKIARDITERKEFERRKDEFLSIASHELKTPLTTLQGLTQFLLRKLEPEERQDIVLLLHTMQTQTRRLHRIVNDLVEASKIKAGHLDYEEHAVDLTALVKETSALLQLIYPTHTLFVQKVDHQAWVMGDADHLNQVITNLVSNATKYAPEASTVTITLTTTETTVALSVHDEGMGIPKAAQLHVFDQFYRVPGRQTKTTSGLGLGLYITAGIVKRHRGDITVSSQERQGTTFSVILPRHQCEEEI